MLTSPRQIDIISGVTPVRIDMNKQTIIFTDHARCPQFANRSAGNAPIETPSSPHCHDTPPTIDNFCPTLDQHRRSRLHRLLVAGGTSVAVENHLNDKCPRLMHRVGFPYISLTFFVARERNTSALSLALGNVE